MGFWGQWFEKLWVVSKLRFHAWIEIKPPLIIDSNEYCPLCGHRKGRILGVTDGTRAACRHFCEECGWIWDVEPVTKIEPKSIIPDLHTQKEDEEEGLINPRHQPRFVPIPPRGDDGVKVNDQKLPDKGIGDRVKGAVVAKL